MTDYCIYALESQLSLKEEFAYNMLQLLESEHEYILECYAEGMVLEAGMLNDQKNATKEKTKTSLWEKIKAFFKRIFGTFSDKAKAFVDRDGKWITDNAESVLTKNYKGVKMEVFHYKGFTFIQSEFNKIIRELDVIKPTDPNANDKINSIVKKYSNSEGNFIEGIKMHFRMGNPKGKISYTTYKGNAINEQAKIFHEYCKSYSSTVVPWVKNEMNLVEKLIKNNDNAIINANLEKSKEPVKDSFLMIEGCYNYQLPGLFNTSLLEATDADGKDTNGLSPKGGSISSDETVTKNNDTNNATNEVADNGALGQMKAILTYAQNVTTAAMTICEEMYVTYMEKLKGLSESTKK